MLLPNHTFHGQISCCIQPRTCMCHLCMTLDLLNLYIWASAEAKPQRVANLGSPCGRAHASCHCDDRRPSQRCVQPSEDCGRFHACIELDGLYWTQLRYVIMASCHQCNNSAGACLLGNAQHMWLEWINIKHVQRVAMHGESYVRTSPSCTDFTGSWETPCDTACHVSVC